MDKDSRLYDYDVCFSFAGEDRAYVEEVAEHAKRAGIRVFYDLYEEVDLWGKDLFEHLDEIYKNSAKYCVLFVSQHYAKKLWTNHERKSAQERAFKENSEYILPARFDETPIPGLRETIGYVDLTNKSPKKLAEMISKKVGYLPKAAYFPPYPNLLLEEFGAESDEEESEIIQAALSFMHVAKRMSNEERKAVFSAFVYCCPGELPDNIHININFLSRVSGISPTHLLRIFSDISCLRFESHLREDTENEECLGKNEMLVISWFDFSFGEDGNATEVVNEMVDIVQKSYCEDHLIEALCILDFSSLSNVTASDGCDH